MTTINGVLTIEGPLADLGAVIRLLEREFPNGLGSSIAVEVAAVDGWTVENARVLLRRLAAKQRGALELVVRSGGFADGHELRERYANEKGQIRGLTGPISKHVNKLIAEGTLPEGTPAPTLTEYDPEVPSFQRAGGIRMRSDLVPIFVEAIDGL